MKNRVFEITLSNSANFYSYLTLHGISFTFKEKPNIFVFTCDMTDEQFTEAKVFCDKFSEQRRFQDALKKCKRLDDEYTTIQKVKSSFAEFFDSALKQVETERKAAQKEFTKLCWNILLDYASQKKDYPFCLIMESEIVSLVKEDGLFTLRRTGKIKSYGNGIYSLRW